MPRDLHKAPRGSLHGELTRAWHEGDTKRNKGQGPGGRARPSGATHRASSARLEDTVLTLPTLPTVDPLLQPGLSDHSLISPGHLCWPWY